MRLLKLMILPLIIASLITGELRFRRRKQEKKIPRKIISLFFEATRFRGNKNSEEINRTFLRQCDFAETDVRIFCNLKYYIL